jgi:hypothetical protein
MAGMPTGMPNIKPLSTDPKKSRGLLTTLSVFLFLLSLAASGYVGWKKNWLESRMVKTQEGIDNMQQKIDKLLEGDKVLLKYRADKIIAQVEPNRIIWSQVFEDISLLESASIQFENFAVTPKNKVSISGRGLNWEKISSFIEELKANKQVKNPFISSISDPLDNSEIEINNPETWTNFSLVFNYVPKKIRHPQKISKPNKN